MAETDFIRLEKSRQERGNVIISHETCPGFFLLAWEYVVTPEANASVPKLAVPVPKYWKRHVSKIHLLEPAAGQIQIKNGSRIETIPAGLVREVLGIIQFWFESEGFQVTLGAPTRFERADVI